MFNFITLDGWHINLCQVSVFYYYCDRLKIWTSESEDPLVISDPDRIWYAKLCKAVGVDPVFPKEVNHE